MFAPQSYETEARPPVSPAWSAAHTAAIKPAHRRSTIASVRIPPSHLPSPSAAAGRSEIGPPAGGSGADGGGGVGRFGTAGAGRAAGAAGAGAAPRTAVPADVFAAAAGTAAPTWV